MQIADLLLLPWLWYIDRQQVCLHLVYIAFKKDKSTIGDRHRDSNLANELDALEKNCNDYDMLEKDCLLEVSETSEYVTIFNYDR